MLTAAAVAVPASPALAAGTTTSTSTQPGIGVTTGAYVPLGVTTAAFVPFPAAVPAKNVPAKNQRGETALRFARAQLGKPYVYGGTGPNAYDCSGLTQRSWRAAGVSIPRTTYEQAHVGSYVPLSQIQVGDLVLFYPDASHVGIYAGNGEVVVAPHSGAVVKVQQMRWMPIYTVRRPG